MIGSKAILGSLRKKRAHLWEQHMLMIVVVSIVVTRIIIVIVAAVVVGVIVSIGRGDWRVQETYSMRCGAAFMLVFFHTQMSKI